MYITINGIIGEKRIDLFYSIKNFDSRKEFAVITMFSDNTRYEVEKAFTFILPTSPGNKVLISSRSYTGRELIHFLGMVDLTDFVNNAWVSKKNKLSGITEMIINSNELDNSENLEDGRPSNALLTYHVTDDDDKDFTCFEPRTPQYKKLKNGEFTSLTLKIMDQKNNIITDGPQVTVVLHICDCKI